jgi:hypothetical protein
VEDEYLAAAELARALEQRGATVVGPAPDVRRALELLAHAKPLDLDVAAAALQLTARP